MPLSSESRPCACGAAIVGLISSRLVYPPGFKKVRFSDQCLLCAGVHAAQEHSESESDQDEEEDGREEEEDSVDDGADDYYQTLPYIPPPSIPHTCRVLRQHAAVADITRLASTVCSIPQADSASELLVILPTSLAYPWSVFRAVLEMASENPLSAMICIVYAIWILR